MWYSEVGDRERGASVPLLIDGHNLIGQMESIRLGDEDDEAQLVQMLRLYAGRSRGGRVIVVFDGGVRGHPGGLSGQGVEAEFAYPPETADTRLVKRIAELRQPKSWQLVTSDREVAAAARRRSLTVISAQEFARRLEDGLRRPKPAPNPDAKPNLGVAAHELPEWLELFGISMEEAEREDLPLPPPQEARSKRKKRGRR
jgi:uncharacterized protein